jgi:hypothetical protein
MPRRINRDMTAEPKIVEKYRSTTSNERVRRGEKLKTYDSYKMLEKGKTPLLYKAPAQAYKGKYERVEIYSPGYSGKKKVGYAGIYDTQSNYAADIVSNYNALVAYKASLASSRYPTGKPTAKKYAVAHPSDYVKGKPSESKYAVKPDKYQPYVAPYDSKYTASAKYTPTSGYSTQSSSTYNPSVKSATYGGPSTNYSSVYGTNGNSGGGYGGKGNPENATYNLAFLTLRKRKALMEQAKKKKKTQLPVEKSKSDLKIKRTIFNKLGSLESMFGDSTPKKTKQTVRKARKA